MYLRKFLPVGTSIELLVGEEGGSGYL